MVISSDTGRAFARNVQNEVASLKVVGEHTEVRCRERERMERVCGRGAELDGSCLETSQLPSFRPRRVNASISYADTLPKVGGNLDTTWVTIG